MERKETHKTDSIFSSSFSRDKILLLCLFCIFMNTSPSSLYLPLIRIYDYVIVVVRLSVSLSVCLCFCYIFLLCRPSTKLYFQFLLFYVDVFSFCTFLLLLYYFIFIFDVLLFRSFSKYLYQELLTTFKRTW